MGRVSNSIKSYGRRTGYKSGGSFGTKVGGTIGATLGSVAGTLGGGTAGAYALGAVGAAVGERVGRRVGHKIGKAAGSSLGAIAAKSYEKIPIIGSMSKGGPIHKTGLYRLHKGEYVVSKKKAQQINQVLRRKRR